jgi:ribonuclease HI
MSTESGPVHPGDFNYYRKRSMDAQLKGKKPHYLLILDTAHGNPNQWHFTLKEADGTSQFQVDDVEPGVSGERLDLLTIIRALESLDQPSRVTLTTCSQYVRQGMQYALSEWRENKWQWEFFGYMVPIKHADLWQRIDHLLHVHAVECRQRRFDGPHCALAGPKTRQRINTRSWGLRGTADIWLKCAAYIIPHAIRQRMAMGMHALRQRSIHLRTT